MTGDGLYDVLILGYGPVGATLANLLGQEGHRVAVAEMHPEVFDKPRAVNLDQEALRLFQRIGLAEQISHGCVPHCGTNFLGVDGELIKAIYSAPPPYPLGWPANLMFIQPEAERLLRERVETLDSVDVRLEHTAIAFEQTRDVVTVEFDTPSGARTIRARYLVGCDGANSPTREWMGAQQTDLGFSEHYVVVDAWITRDTPLPSRTTQYCYPDAPTSYVICSGNLRRWELKILPGESVDDYNDLGRIKARLAPFVEVDALKLWRSAVYHFNARVADTWQKGRAFLAGDAAHTMPPFLGQGLNSGLRDAANLSWRLTYVLRGMAEETLLESYQTERRPHILAVTEITKDLGKIVGETDPARAADRDQRLRAEMAENGPVTVRQALIPPIAHGFLDKEGGKLAGTLAPQPRVSRDGESHLLDDLMSGFSMVQLAPGDNLLAVTNDLETDAPAAFKCHDTECLLSGSMRDHGVKMMIVRPDGVIWSAGADPAEAIERLCVSFKQPVPEPCQ